MKPRDRAASRRKSRKVHESDLPSATRWRHPREVTVLQPRGGAMAATVTHSLVQQFASMKPSEFGPTIEPKWQVGERLVKEVKGSVEKGHLTPLDGARLISSLTATLFGYDEFILREISPETWLASAPMRR